MLLRPHNHKVGKPSHKEASAFELHVSWPFSLFGLPCIALAEHERLTAPKTSVAIASVDLVAVHRQALIILLLACTFGPVREQDLSNLATAGELIRREVLASTRYRVLPVLITGGSKSSALSPNQSVRILDASDLEELLAMVRERREDQLISFLDGAPTP